MRACADRRSTQTSNNKRNRETTMVAHPLVKPAAVARTPELPHAKPETLGLSSARLRRMSDALKRDVDKGIIPGVTIMVARHGQIGWFDALGRQSPAADAAMSRSTLFRIFSMAKPIVSVATMILIEEGDLQLT